MTRDHRVDVLDGGGRFGDGLAVLDAAAAIVDVDERLSRVGKYVARMHHAPAAKHHKRISIGVSILANDLQRSASFYQSVFGMTPVSEDKPNQSLRLGMKRTIVSLRHEGPSGVVDHFAISVENFNREAVTQQLKQHGLTPQQNVQFGFHIKDPDGAVVQIV